MTIAARTQIATDASHAGGGVRFPHATCCVAIRRIRRLPQYHIIEDGGVFKGSPSARTKQARCRTPGSGSVLAKEV